IVRRAGRDMFVATGEGLIDVTADRVAVLTDLAVEADRIDEAKAEEARRRAEARLRERLSDEELAAVNASLARSLVQLHVKRRRRAGPGRCPSATGRFRRLRTQEHAEGRTARRIVRRFESPAVCLENHPTDGEAHAEALGLACEERLEEPMEVGFGDARAGVV